MELMAAVGILVIISGIGSVFYMRYLENQKLMKFWLTGQNFGKAVEFCLVKHGDDLRKCASFAELKFECDHCEDAFCYDPGGAAGNEERLIVRMENDKYKAHAVYNEVIAVQRPAIRIQELNGNTLKFCSGRQRTLDGNFTGHYSMRLPIKKCQSDSDCQTGQVCRNFPNMPRGCLAPATPIPGR